MRGEITNRKEIFFTCDGGINPSHHQPKGCSIVEENGEYKIWATGHRTKDTFGNYDAALNTLKKRYDFIRQDCTKISRTRKDDRVLKSEQINYRRP